MCIPVNLGPNNSQFVYYKSTEIMDQSPVTVSQTNTTYRMVTKKPETRMVVIGCTVIKKYNKSLLLCLNIK